MTIVHTSRPIVSVGTEAVLRPIDGNGQTACQSLVEWSRKFKENERLRTDRYKRGAVPGQVFVYKTGNTDGTEYIINFPIDRRDHNYLVEGLKELTRVITAHDIKSIAIPVMWSHLDKNDTVRRVETALRVVPGL